MATPVLIPVEEYLNTTYRPDCDYIDGEVIERNVGERPHGILHGVFYLLFQKNRREWGLLPLLEQRVQTSAKNYRVPDVCAVYPGEDDPIVRVAPLLCIEILSSRDTLPAIEKRAGDYLRMGVQHVWIVDPLRRTAHHISPRGTEAVTEALSIPGTSVQVELSDVFRELDDQLQGRL